MFKKILKTFIGVVKLVLGVVLVLVVLLLIFTVFNPIKNFQVLRVMSGSMEPAVKVGSLVFTKKVESEVLREGDIVTYTSLENPDLLITHRLVGIEDREGTPVFKTKGDANNIEDTDEVSPSQLKGKVIFSVPFLGYLSNWVRQPLGFGLLIILPAILIIISEIFNIKKGIEEEVEKKYLEKEKGKKNKNIDSLVALIIMLTGIGFLNIQSTNAYFFDTATIEGITFTMADEWDTPSFSKGDVVINEIMWGGSSGHELDEWVELRNMTDDEINLDGWEIKSLGPSGHSITLSGTIGTGDNQYFLITHFSTDHVNGKSEKAAIDNSITSDLVDKNLNLKNIGEQLVLKDPSGNEIDKTPNVSNEDSWVEGEASPHGPWRSMERVDNPGDGDDADNWDTCTDDECNDDTYWDTDDGDDYGTPGSENIFGDESSEITEQEKNSKENIKEDTNIDTNANPEVETVLIEEPVGDDIIPTEDENSENAGILEGEGSIEDGLEENLDEGTEVSEDLEEDEVL